MSNPIHKTTVTVFPHWEAQSPRWWSHDPLLYTTWYKWELGKGFLFRTSKTKSGKNARVFSFRPAPWDNSLLLVTFPKGGFVAAEPNVVSMLNAGFAVVKPVDNVKFRIHLNSKSWYDIVIN